MPYTFPCQVGGEQSLFLLSEVLPSTLDRDFPERCSGGSFDGDRKGGLPLPDGRKGPETESLSRRATGKEPPFAAFCVLDRRVSEGWRG